MAQKPKTNSRKAATEPTPSRITPRERQLILSGLGKLRTSVERQLYAAQKENNYINISVYEQLLAEIRKTEGNLNAIV